MVTVVIATHGGLANGLKESAEFIMGTHNKLLAVPAYTDTCKNPEARINEIISESDEGVVFLTDIFGGSVNNYIQSILGKKSNLFLVSGANLPMLVQLLSDLDQKKELSVSVNEAINAGKEGVKESRDIEVTSDEKFDSF